MKKIVRRKPASLQLTQQFISEGLSPLMARLYASRGVAATEIDVQLSALLPFTLLKNIDAVALALCDAIIEKKHLLVIADYDTDGATACAVAMLGLSKLKAHVDFLVPNRFEYGYGLSPELVELAAQKKPDILLTVDNGIASVAGIECARSLGIEVLVTDHHLPGDVLPDALIVNPNQPGCAFPSKSIAGVGVIFYVLLAVRAGLRERNFFNQFQEPNLATLLDLVALGTVADMVCLDRNNRIMVAQGLKRIRAGKMRPGLAALFALAGRDFAKASTFDLGFVLGPRLNAAGRMQNMSIGIACLLAEDDEVALNLAKKLDRLNQERRTWEKNMHGEALQVLDNVNIEGKYTVTLYQPDWHQGIVGILASRIKERFNRPCIVFAQADGGWIRGSGRSIPGFHLRDALDLVSKKYPDLIYRFGGHAMAVGLTIAEDAFDDFYLAFEEIASELIDIDMLVQQIEVDGELCLEEMTIENVELLSVQVWGQGFPHPQFLNQFNIISQRVVGGNHLKLLLERDNVTFDAMLFNQKDWLPDTIEAVYHMVVNEWKNRKTVELYLDYWQECGR